MNFIFLLATCCFVFSLSMRLVDPLVPEIARDLSTSPESVALLSTAFLLSYAIAQPFVGGLADSFGKVRMIKICSAAMAAMLVVMTFAPNIEVLYASRLIGGIFAGGVFSIALALVGDRIAIEQRQVALSNLIMASQTAQLFGIIAAGMIAATFGWRSAIGAAAVIAIAATVLLERNLHPRPGIVRPPFNIARLQDSFVRLAHNRHATTCYLGVFFDGLAVPSLMPFVAILLEADGRGGLREAGFVIAGLALGGFIYTLSVKRLLALVGGPYNLLRFGGAISALGMVAVSQGGPWPQQMAEFAVTGFGFFMVHGSLQNQATVVPADLRAMSVACHSASFILGNAIGPVLYAIGINTIGAEPSILLGALIIFLTGVVSAQRLARIDAATPTDKPAEQPSPANE